MVPRNDFWLDFARAEDRISLARIRGAYRRTSRSAREPSTTLGVCITTTAASPSSFTAARRCVETRRYERKLEICSAEMVVGLLFDSLLRALPSNCAASPQTRNNSVEARRRTRGTQLVEKRNGIGRRAGNICPKAISYCSLRAKNNRV